MSIDKIKEDLKKALTDFTIEDFNIYTMNELYRQIANKTNEVIEIVKLLQDYLDEQIFKDVENIELKQKVLENIFNQLIINAGNSNAEIVDARVEANGTIHNKLGDRLNSIDSQIKENTTQQENLKNNKYDKSGGELTGEITVNINGKKMVIGEIDVKGNFIIKTTMGSNIYIIPELEEGFSGTYRRVYFGGEIRPTQNSKYMNGTYDSKWEEVNTRFLRAELNADDHGTSIADFAQNNPNSSGYIRVFEGTSGKENTGVIRAAFGFIKKWASKTFLSSNGNDLLLSTDELGNENKKHIVITGNNADILPSTTRLQNIGSPEKRFENGYFGGIVQTGRFPTTGRPNLTSTNSGAMIYDNTIGKPIWWTGTKWIDATGTQV